ncbi:hypothetical protein [Fredinandcohnia quinoae]|uniref:hypothetical protein n=1 Tax=Fredinandcohnia quinoae TaxID=2918902 RepID=UPI001F05555D|nr:hypothetical protein [Fredinandcohnia sp. SECRCQ15]
MVQKPGSPPKKDEGGKSSGANNRITTTRLKAGVGGHMQETSRKGGNTSNCTFISKIN